jgi:hypothetical protein
MRPNFGRFFLAIAAVLAWSTLAFAQTPPLGAGVTGVIVARFGGLPVPLPDINVTLINRDSGMATAPIATDLNGRFGFLPQLRGTYRLCWRGTGWRPGCLATPIVVGGTTERVGLVPIDRDPGLRFVRGGVTLADGTPCRFSSPFFGIDLTAGVSALNADGRVVAGPVRANTLGQYVLAGLPQTAVRVRATCDRASVGAPIGASRSDAGILIDLHVRNFRPEVRGFLPTLAGRPVRRVPPGAVVKVEAAVTDRDGDPLSFSWMAAERSGVVTRQADGTATWALPRGRGLQVLYLLASDRKGGIRQGRLTLNVGTGGVFFSGVVTGRGGAVVPGAMVQVNDATIATDRHGVFTILATEDPNDRYVVTVMKPGYVPLSRIFDDGGGGTSWRLVPAQVTMVDPRRNINIQERESPGHKGAHLRIAADSLVDESGAPARGAVNIALATLDPDHEPLPGNDGGIDAVGRKVVINQFGGVYLDVSDAAGHHYMLKRGARARVTFPVAQSRLRSRMRPPHQIDMWAYDGVTGYWQPRGTAKFTGLEYDYELFGDLVIVGGGGIPQVAPGCLLIYGQFNQRSLGLSVRVTPAGSPPLPPFAITGYYNTMIPIPPLTPVTLELLDDIGDVVQKVKFYGGPNLDLLPNNVALPGHPLKSMQFPFPTYCSSQVTFALDFPFWAGYPGSELLQQNVPPTTPGYTSSYYAAVDPQSKRTTLGGWWGQNGFNANGVASGDTLATYLNTNELGVGSYVRCTQSSDHTTTGCYMTIYGNPDGHPGNADLAHNVAKDYASWTLAIERRAVETNPPKPPLVKFFAYKGPDAGSPRVESVDLDGLGSRNLPSVCVVCHGGGYFSVKDNTFDNVDPFKTPEVHASFREFDRSTLQPPSGQNVSVALDALNAIVRHGNPIYADSQSGVAIAELIDGWYQSNTFDPTFVPAGWKGSAADQTFYSNVVAKSCRTCHVAFDPVVNWAVQSHFLENSNFSEGLTCPDNGRVMPNAVMTYVNFWLSNRPALLKNYLGWSACPVSP